MSNQTQNNNKTNFKTTDLGLLVAYTTMPLGKIPEDDFIKHEVINVFEAYKKGVTQNLFILYCIRFYPLVVTIDNV